MSGVRYLMWLSLCACSPVDQRVAECSPGDERPGGPQTIAEAVDHINALPRPVTGPCVVASIRRALQVEATDSFFSAQPAVGERSPRLFLFSGALTLSVAPEGDGKDLLEFAEKTTEGRSIKGELALPIEGVVPADGPYRKVLNAAGDGTVCAICHPGEWLHDEELGAYDSIALRPETESLVAIDSVIEQAHQCDAQAEPQRCALLSALVDHGPIEHHAFPPTYRTIYGD